MTRSLHKTFIALAEPNRLRIIALLRDGPRTVGDIAAALRLRQPQVSKHLKTLRDARLVRVEAHAQTRCYHLDPTPLRALSTWLDR